MSLSTVITDDEELVLALARGGVTTVHQFHRMKEWDIPDLKGYLADMKLTIFQQGDVFSRLHRESFRLRMINTY